MSPSLSPGWEEEVRRGQVLFWKSLWLGGEGARGEGEAVGILFPVLVSPPGPGPDLDCQHLKVTNLGRSPQNFKMGGIPNILNPFSVACSMKEENTAKTG